MADDRVFMGRALELAERGWGRVHPNPMVGAVVVRDGVVVGEGFHGEYGGPHAEVVALAAAGERALGATLYVTLEPCSHYGKTPPCTNAIEAAGIARLVYAAEDTSTVAGGGADRLRAAGVEVVGGVERDAARAQNAAFFHAIEYGRPYLVLKYGLTLDARLAEREGRPSNVTGPEARARVQYLRAGFDAIMVGSGTAIADDPLLTVRGEITPRVPPARVVIDSAARLPTSSRLVRTLGEAPVWVVCREDASPERRRDLERAGVEAITVPVREGGVDLEAALDRLWAKGVRSILCEGGGKLGGALLAADLVDRLDLFYAPRLFGETGVAAFPGRFTGMVRTGWRRRKLEVLGEDFLLVLDRER